MKPFLIVSKSNGSFREVSPSKLDILDISAHHNQLDLSAYTNPEKKILNLDSYTGQIHANVDKNYKYAQKLDSLDHSRYRSSRSHNVLGFTDKGADDYSNINALHVLKKDRTRKDVHSDLIDGIFSDFEICRDTVLDYQPSNKFTFRTHDSYKSTYNKNSESLKMEKTKFEEKLNKSKLENRNTILTRITNASDQKKQSLNLDSLKCIDYANCQSFTDKSCDRSDRIYQNLDSTDLSDWHKKSKSFIPNKTQIQRNYCKRKDCISDDNHSPERRLAEKIIATLGTKSYTPKNIEKSNPSIKITDQKFNVYDYGQEESLSQMLKNTPAIPILTSKLILEPNIDNESQKIQNSHANKYIYRNSYENNTETPKKTNENHEWDLIIKDFNKKKREKVQNTENKNSTNTKNKAAKSENMTEDYDITIIPSDSTKKSDMYYTKKSDTPTKKKHKKAESVQIKKNATKNKKKFYDDSDTTQDNKMDFNKYDRKNLSMAVKNSNKKNKSTFLSINTCSLNENQNKAIFPEDTKSTGKIEDSNTNFTTLYNSDIFQNSVNTGNLNPQMISTDCDQNIKPISSKIIGNDTKVFSVIKEKPDISNEKIDTNPPTKKNSQDSIEWKIYVSSQEDLIDNGSIIRKATEDSSLNQFESYLNAKGNKNPGKNPIYRKEYLKNVEKMEKEETISNEENLTDQKEVSDKVEILSEGEIYSEEEQNDENQTYTEEELYDESKSDPSPREKQNDIKQISKNDSQIRNNNIKKNDSKKYHIFTKFLIKILSNFFKRAINDGFGAIEDYSKKKVNRMNHQKMSLHTLINLHNALVRKIQLRFFKTIASYEPSIIEKSDFNETEKTTENKNFIKENYLVPGVLKNKHMKQESKTVNDANSLVNYEEKPFRTMDFINPETENSQITKLLSISATKKHTFNKATRLDQTLEKGFVNLINIISQKKLLLKNTAYYTIKNQSCHNKDINSINKKYQFLNLLYSKFENTLYDHGIEFIYRLKLNCQTKKMKNYKAFCGKRLINLILIHSTKSQKHSLNALRTKCASIYEQTNVFFPEVTNAFENRVLYENNNTYDDLRVIYEDNDSFDDKADYEKANSYGNKIAYNPAETITEKNSEYFRSTFSSNIKQDIIQTNVKNNKRKFASASNFSIIKRINDDTDQSPNFSGIVCNEDLESEKLYRTKIDHQKKRSDFISNVSDNGSLPASLNQYLWDYNKNVKDEIQHGFASDQFVKYIPSEKIDDQESVDSKLGLVNYLSEGNNEEEKSSNDIIFTMKKKSKFQAYNSMDFDHDEPLPEIVLKSKVVSPSSKIDKFMDISENIKVMILNTNSDCSEGQNAEKSIKESCILSNPYDFTQNDKKGKIEHSGSDNNVTKNSNDYLFNNNDSLRPSKAYFAENLDQIVTNDQTITNDISKNISINNFNNSLNNQTQHKFSSKNNKLGSIPKHNPTKNYKSVSKQKNKSITKNSSQLDSSSNEKSYFSSKTKNNTDNKQPEKASQKYKSKNLLKKKLEIGEKPRTALKKVISKIDEQSEDITNTFDNKDEVIQKSRRNDFLKKNYKNKFVAIKKLTKKDESNQKVNILNILITKIDLQ